MVHLNITLDEELYKRLKEQTPPKGMSAFIAAALEERLRPSNAMLEQAYRAAAKEPWRRQLQNDWDETVAEGWPTE